MATREDGPARDWAASAESVLGRTPAEVSAERHDFKPGATIALLAERYPNVFAIQLERVRPLAVGICQTLRLFAPDIPSQQLRAALKAYCRHGSYLRAMVEGAPRIDLDGAPSGVVTGDAARHAAERLAAVEAAAARRAAQAKAAFAARPQPKPPTASVVDVRRPNVPSGPRRLGLADLRAAGRARRLQGGSP
jgi:ProP effector